MLDQIPKHNIPCSLDYTANKMVNKILRNICQSKVSSHGKPNNQVAHVLTAV
jgi:hypothetical protein